MKRMKLVSSLAVASAIVSSALSPVSAAVNPNGTVPATGEKWNTRTNKAYDPNQPATWRQTYTPFSNQHYTPSREKNATYGAAGCGAFALTSLWLKTGYKQTGFTPDQAGQWLDTVARDYTKSYSKDESPKTLHSFVENDEDGVTLYYQAYLGDYMDLANADPGVRYFSTANDEVAFGERKNDRVNVWRAELAQAYPTRFPADADEWIRAEYAKGRFIAIVMDVTNGQHIAIVDEILPDGTIVMVDSGGGFRYWEGMKAEWGAKARAVYSYQARGLDIQDSPKFWRGDSPNKAMAAIAKYATTVVSNKKYVYDQSNTLATEKVIQQGSNGVTLKNGGAISTASPTKISFGAKVVPYKTIYKVNESLKPGEEKVVRVGINGRENTKHNFKIEKQDRIVEYGPQRLAPSVERRAVTTLPPGAEQVVSEGTEGLVDREGNVLKKATPKVVEYGAKETPYKVRLERSDSVTKRTVKTRGEKGRVDENGKVLKEAVDEVVLVPKNYDPAVDDREEIAFTTKFVMNESLQTGERKVVQAGKNGSRSLVDESDVVEPIEEVIEYGPEKIMKTIRYVANNDLKAGERNVKQEGSNGTKDINGQVVTQPIDMIIEVGPSAIPYSTEVKATTDLPEGVTKVVVEGESGLRSYDGYEIKAATTEVILKGIKKQDADNGSIVDNNVANINDYKKPEPTEQDKQREKDVQDALNKPVRQDDLVDSPTDVSVTDQKVQTEQKQAEQTKPTEEKNSSAKRLPNTGVDTIVQYGIGGAFFSGLAGLAIFKRKKLK